MSERCTIGYEDYEGNVTAVYCHHNGHPRWQAKKLLEAFDHEDYARELVDNGCMSQLGDSIETTTFYVRDWKRSWSDNAPIMYDSRLEAHIDGRYFYLYSLERECWLYSSDSGRSWCKLEHLEWEER